MTAQLGSSTWPELPVAPLLLVPVGSTEQHGPHLPFATDAIIAAAVAEAVAHRLGPPVVVAPTIAYGASGEHQDFPGTASIGSEALRLLVLELARSVSGWTGRVVLVNAHGGNVPTLSSVVPQLIGEQHGVAWVPCAVRHGDAHAGLTETSLMLHLAPDSVTMALAAPGNTTPVSELLGTMALDGVRSVSPGGVLGDPTGATPQHGAELLRRMVDDIVLRVRTGSPDARGCLVAR